MRVILNPLLVEMLKKYRFSIINVLFLFVNQFFLKNFLNLRWSPLSLFLCQIFSLLNAVTIRRKLYFLYNVFFGHLLPSTTNYSSNSIKSASISCYGFPLDKLVFFRNSSINRGKWTPKTNSFHNFSKKSSYWTCVPLPDAI